MGRSAVNGNCWKLGRGKRVLLSLAIIAATFAGLNWFDRVRAEAPEVAGPPIEYDHLANQETDPFLFSGKLMDENHPQWGRYRKALHKYYDVRDCLLETEKGKEKPNLLLVDWRGLRSGVPISVCAFRIARSLKDLERIRQWLIYHQFRVSALNRIYGENFAPKYKTQPVYNMQGSWSREQYRRINSSWFAEITGFDPVYGYGLQFQFSDDLTTVGVNTMSSSE